MNDRSYHGDGWRDVGDGRVRHDDTGAISVVSSRVLVPAPSRSMTFTAAEWAKLVELAATRSDRRHTWTPADCVRDFVAHCKPEGVA